VTGIRDACEACLRRALLLQGLAGHIERVATKHPGSRSRELLALSDAELVEALSGPDRRGVLERVRNVGLAPLDAELDGATCWTTCAHAGSYPDALRALGGEAPAALFGRGDESVLTGLEPGAAVTIVGARRASAYGLGVARELGRMLGGSGITVVSGLALGIDSEAHRGALEGRGSTLAVLGSGPERAYPPSRRRLYERIVDGGAVLSELPPGTAAFRWTFPARNRIMAALANVTVVVEAAERSGSLITAGMAIDAGREVGAVPGPVTAWLCAGTNQLLADGALVIRDAQDVLDALLGPGADRVRDTGPSLEPALAAVLDCVERGDRTPDAVVAELGAPASEVAAHLARLELLGYLQTDVAGTYSRTPLMPPRPLHKLSE
jgi:DNA processing protein